MKKSILIAFFSMFIINFLHAQDVIVKKNGDEIKVKIEEVSANDIKYKKYDNLDGPLFYIPKSDVFMVRYEDGSKETFIEKPEPQPKKTTKTTYVQPQVTNTGGPRIGITHIGPGKMRTGLDDNFGGKPTLSQFGWAFESRLFTTKQGASGTLTFIPLIAGVEQGLFLPSVTGLVGVRTSGGFDFSIGPNLSIGGAGLAMMAGTTVKLQGIDIPMHIAAVPTNKGIIFNFLVGFNIPKN
ncbi:MAG: hypothetical protein ACXWDO_06240 [Bacteroidia bacterium]